MNAEDTKKAMKCCMKTFPLCHGCPLKGTCITEQRKPLKKALELINQYEAEIERLKEEKLQVVVPLNNCGNSFMVKDAKTIRAEAIKEFAERLLKNYFVVDSHFEPPRCDYWDVRNTINALVKEMMEEQE